LPFSSSSSSSHLATALAHFYVSSTSLPNHSSTLSSLLSSLLPTTQRTVMLNSTAGAAPLAMHYGSALMRADMSNFHLPAAFPLMPAALRENVTLSSAATRYALSQLAPSKPLGGGTPTMIASSDPLHGTGRGLECALSQQLLESKPTYYMDTTNRAPLPTVHRSMPWPTESTSHTLPAGTTMAPDLVQQPEVEQDEPAEKPGQQNILITCTKRSQMVPPVAPMIVPEQGKEKEEGTDMEPAPGGSAAATTPGSHPRAGTEMRNLFLARHKPKRSRNAYNFFFQHERANMIQEELAKQAKQLTSSRHTAAAAVVNHNMTWHDHQSTPALPNDKPKRLLHPNQRHVQVISQKWHTLSLEQRAPYKALEEQDKERHRQEQALYLQYQHAACKEVYRELLEIKKERTT